MRLLLFSVIFLSIQSAYSQGIEFQKLKWQEAIEMANEKGKLLFVDSYAEWCGPCKKMAKHEFVKKEVGEVYNSNFINLKLDMESKNGRTFDSQYPVSAYPTMFFLSGEGEVVKKIRGGQKADQLIKMANDAIKSYDRSGEYADKYDEGDRSYETVFNYVNELNKVDRPSLKISNDYLKSNPDITNEQLLKFYHAATVDADSKIFEKMIEKKSAVAAIVGEEEYNNKVKSAVRKTLAKAIEYEAESLLDEAIEKAETGLTSGGEFFSLILKSDYAVEMKDASLMKDVVKKISKKIDKDDTKTLKSTSQKIQSNFAKDDDLMTSATKMAKKYHKQLDNKDSAIFYAATLTKVNDYSEAIKVIKERIEQEEKQGNKTNQLEGILNKLEMKKA